MKIILSILITLSVIYCQKGNAQDFLLNQNTYTLVIINPATVGQNEALNLSTYYHNVKFTSAQSSSAYHNFGINVDAPVISREKFVISAGYRYYGSVAGESNFKNEGHLLSTSLSKIIALDKIVHRFSLGIEAGFNMKSIDDKNLRWPTQIGPNGFAPSIPSGEYIADVINPDFNAGMQYHLSTQRGHLNRPDISFLSGHVQENYKTNIYLTGGYRMTPKFELHPSFIYVKHGTEEMYNISLGSKYYIQPKSWICLDLGYLQYEQVYAGISGGFKGYTIFWNYGFNMNQTFNRFEGGLRYTFEKVKK
jgi:type IX secretion system PorP/SprF family membrane protein